ncbi:DNA repair and recombination protein RadA [Candidatus Bathyarchaeota archaeon]|nr:MAG: DNA repair and recombination protein RadA [Candidatus Bathyarchaeota archaeon]
MSETLVTQEAVRKYEVVEDLPGVGPSTSEKLKELGFHTIESLATATVRELVPAGIGEKQAAKIIAEARDSISLSFVRADELMKMKANVRRLTTGSKAFDGLIGGGLETQTITEVYGEYGVGKSILCHQLAINVQLPVDKGGLDGGALYLDTEQTFRPEWIVRMAKTAGLEPTDVAQRIIYSEAYNSDHQILLLEKADQIIKDNNIRLIIIDSLTSHFRSEYIGREMLAERQQRLNNHMHRLIRLARGFNAVAIVTNQVMAKPDQFFANSVDAVGGHIVAHTSHTRVFLPQVPVNKFLEQVEARAWTDAEKELDIIRQKSDNSQWSRGYVKALEGLMLTYRNNDDKYIFLPRVLANRTEDTISNLKKEFSEFAANELHGDYDRGYFKALDDYFTLLGSIKNPPAPVETPPPEQATLDQSTTSTGQG